MRLDMPILIHCSHLLAIPPESYTLFHKKCSMLILSSFLNLIPTPRKLATQRLLFIFNCLRPLLSKLVVLWTGQLLMFYEFLWPEVTSKVMFETHLPGIYGRLLWDKNLEYFKPFHPAKRVCKHGLGSF